MRDYATKVRNAELKAKYEALAKEIDKIYDTAPLPDLLHQHAAIFTAGPWLQTLLRQAAREYGTEASADHRYGVMARLLAELRQSLPRIRSASARLRVLDLSLVEEETRFFTETPKTQLREIFARATQDPITRNGPDIQALRQGSFFTRGGKQRVPGTNSYATSRELLHYLLRLEQGKLVDAFSSREIKRLLYVTERRIRYASSPALHRAAVYFKSGSLYKCKPEPNLTCRKYHGNVRNFMNSAAIVESPAGQNQLYYMVTLLSNVLRKNSAVDHQTLATRIHRLLEADHPAPSGPDDAG